MSGLSNPGLHRAVGALAQLAGLHWRLWSGPGLAEADAADALPAGCGLASCPLRDPTVTCPAAAWLPLDAAAGLEGPCLAVCRGDRLALPPRREAEVLAGALGQVGQVSREMDQTVRELAVTYQELAIAYGTLEALGDTGSSEAIAAAVLDRVASAVGAAGGCFVTLGELEGVTTLAAANLPAGEVEMLRQMAASRAAQAHSSLPFSFDLGQRHFLACPIRDTERRLGLLFVCRDTRHPFTSREGKLLQATGRQAALAVRNRSLVDDLRSLFMSTVQALAAAIEAKDPYTSGHSRRVADMAQATALGLGLEERVVSDVHLAAVVHDIGKIGVDTGILRKPGALDDQEWVALRAHPDRGAGIIGCVPQLRHLMADVRHHHERVDGSGYPHGLPGEDIPVGARIIAVCDAYDAMTSARPYRPPMSAEAAWAELVRGAGRQFAPEIVSAFRGTVVA